MAPVESTGRAAEVNGSGEDVVTLSQLAAEFGMPKTNLRKWAIKKGFSFHKRRIPGMAGSQQQSVLSPAEADELRRLRREAGFIGGSASRPIANEVGVFYAVALVPEFDPRRIKLGFAEDMGDRLSQHRTSAPTATVLRIWPCRRSWEKTVMAAMSFGCRLVWGEVFECDDVVAFLARGDAIFALLPPPDHAMPMSAHASGVVPDCDD